MEHDVLVTLDFTLTLRMMVALSIGALIGLERERHREGRAVLAGIRTYPLVALAGVLFTFLGDHVGNDAYIAVGAAVFGAISLVQYWARHQLGIHGLTSPIALFLTYLTGALIGLGFLLEGILAGFAIAVLLFTKHRLHRLAEVMTEEEMGGALQFIVIAFILFPILPDTAIDPWGLFNPFRIILVVLFVSTLGFVSFLVMRFLGATRGLTVSGLLGGLVNSEATTASLAGVAADKPELNANAVTGITLTNGTMLVRNLVIAAFVARHAELLMGIAPPLIAMFLIQAIIALRHHIRGTTTDTAIRLGNPFAIWPAVKFGLMFVLLQAASFALGLIPGAGDTAVLLTAAGGLVSSAAVVASVSALAADGAISVPIAAATAVLATVVSTLNKIILVHGVAPQLVRPVATRMLVPAAVGLAVLAVTLFML